MMAYVPYLLGSVAFALMYTLMMFLVGPFASMIVAQVFSMGAAVFVFLLACKFLERASCSND